MYVDVHCHLDLMDVEKTIENARKAGIVKILTAGINTETNEKALALAKQHDIVEAACGVYPEFLEDVWKGKEGIAVGEVGLDGTLPDMEKQEVLFRSMIRLALKQKKPLIVHSRKAEQRVLDMLAEEGAKKVILHCFCGKKTLVKEAAKRGYSFSIPANVERATQFQLIVKEVALNQLFTETDSPYLSPVPGEENEPANVVQAVKAIAKIKGFEEEEVKKNIFMNWQQMF